MSLMALLPVAELLSRYAGFSGVPGSTVFVQHLTLWVAFLGAALAAASDRLLSISANTFLPERWAAPVRIAGCGLTAAIATGLFWASCQFVVAQREGGAILALGIAKWVVQLVMPFGFLMIAIRAILGAGPRAAPRIAAALFLLIPLAMWFAPQPQGSTLLWIGIPVILVGAVFGLPIFATLGGIALLLFWNAGLPIGSIPVETYRLVASPVLPSLPLFTLAGYLLVEGGASVRLLRVYTALFGWLPGGLAISTAVGCAIFTWAGSGRDHSLHGRPVAAHAGESALSRAFLHRADQRVGLAGAAVPAQPAGDPLRDLFADRHQHAVRRGIRSRHDDGDDGFRAGASSKPCGAAPSARHSRSPKREKPFGTPSGRSPCPSSCSSDSSAASARWWKRAPSR